MRTFIAWPSLAKMSGGMAVLANIGRTLWLAGHDCAIVIPDSGQKLALPDSGCPTLPMIRARPEPGDVWLLPEGWPGLLLPGLRAGARCVVYCQNWAYLPATLPPGLSFASLPLTFLAVSRPVAWHIRRCTGQDAAILPPGIDLDCFYPLRDEQKTGRVRIAWMPRKNKALATQIREILALRCLHTGLAAPEWVEIQNRSREEVAAILRSCQIFLATGFPEGCPLPPLEAMASGCLVVGFAGFGGWDYMRQAWPGGFRPAYAGLEPGAGPEDSGTGNGFFVPDGDTVAAALALEDAIRLVSWHDREHDSGHDNDREKAETLAGIRSAALSTARSYSLEAQGQILRELWQEADKWQAAASLPD